METTNRMKTRLPLFASLPLSLALLLHGVAAPQPGAASAPGPMTVGASPGAPIPIDELGATATAQYTGEGLAVSATPDGARLGCAFQRIDGEATPVRPDRRQRAVFCRQTEREHLVGTGDRFRVGNCVRAGLLRNRPVCRRPVRDCGRDFGEQHREVEWQYLDQSGFRCGCRRSERERFGLWAGGRGRGPLCRRRFYHGRHKCLAHGSGSDPAG